jgi:hypothetical protein
MAKRRQPRKTKRAPKKLKALLAADRALQAEDERSSHQLVEKGQSEAGHEVEDGLAKAGSDVRQKALIANDLATLTPVNGDTAAARSRLRGSPRH